MPRALTSITLAFFFLFAAGGCQKADLENCDPELHLSSNVVLRGQGLGAWVTQCDTAGTIYDWSYLPVYRSFFQPWKENLGIAFLTAGKYELKVRLYKKVDGTPLYATLSDSVTVLDSIYTGPVEPGTLESPGDTILLEPSFAGDSTLVFLAKTKKSFPCQNSYLQVENTSRPGEIEAEFKSVWVPQSQDCIEGLSPARSVLFTGQFFHDGEYDINITFNNQLYTGKVKVINWMTKWEFVWTYTSGIIIFPNLISH